MLCADAPVATNRAAAARAHCASFMKIAPRGLTLVLIPRTQENPEIFGNPELFGPAAFGSFRGADNAVPLLPAPDRAVPYALAAAVVSARRRESGSRPTLSPQNNRASAR